MSRRSLLESDAEVAGKTAEELLREALELHKSIEGAARALNLLPTSVRRAMEKYGLQLRRDIKVVKVQPQHSRRQRSLAKGE